MTPVLVPVVLSLPRTNQTAWHASSIPENKRKYDRSVHDQANIKHTSMHAPCTQDGESYNAGESGATNLDL